MRSFRFLGEYQRLRQLIQRASKVELISLVLGTLEHTTAIAFNVLDTPVALYKINASFGYGSPSLVWNHAFAWALFNTTSIIV